MRTKFVAGNWKMNLTKTSSMELARSIARGIPNNVDVGVAPPFVYLDAVGGVLAGSKVMLGAQDAYCEAGGAYTGEICVPMLKDLGVRFCLSGHSERRHILKEPSDLVARKTESIYSGGLIPIHCVGETLDERDANKTLDVVRSQMGEISRKIDDPNRLVIAYEPVWAIGTGRNATDQQAQEVHAFIRQTLAKMWNGDFASRVRIQYGGSMKPENARSLLSQPDVDGGLIGGASLKTESFLAIVNAAAQA
jgi:triosephosphate isomerase